MNIPLIFKNGQGVVLDFVDEVARHEGTDVFQRSTPSSCKGVQYGLLCRRGGDKLSKVESEYFGALYCSTMQMLLKKRWVYYANGDKTTTGSRLRRLFSEELLPEPYHGPFVRREWKKKNRCALLMAARVDLATPRVPTITVLTEPGKRWLVRRVTWNRVHLTRVHLTRESDMAFAGAQGAWLKAHSVPLVHAGGAAWVRGGLDPLVTPERHCSGRGPQR
jgi:hypothetical protein